MYILHIRPVYAAHRLSPLDFALWTQAQQAYEKYQPKNITEARTAVTLAIDTISQESIDRAIDAFIPRVKKVVENRGGHIEKL